MLAPPPAVSRDAAAADSDRRPRRGLASWLAGVLATLLGLVVVLAFVAAVFLAVVTRTSDRGVPTVFGYRPLVVLSGSMSPTFYAGDLIVDRAVTPAQAAHLQRSQVISFAPGAGSLVAGTIISHRIYKVSQEVSAATGRSTTVYQTKGDANPAPDGDAVTPGQIVGVYQFRIPYAGYVLNELHQPAVFIVLVSLPFAVLVVAEARRRWGGPEPGRG